MDTEGLENLKEFFGFFNNVHPSIKFTMEYFQKQINFLEVLVSKNDNESNLVTSLFTKSIQKQINFLDVLVSKNDNESNPPTVISTYMPHHAIDQFIKIQYRMAKSLE